MQENSLAYSASSTDLRTSLDFCEFVSALRHDDIPSNVQHECKRSLLDWMGCAIAGSQTDTVQRLKGALQLSGSLPKVQVIGHSEKMGLLESALINGQMGHVLDFDDTHMDGVVLHTSSPVLAALFSAATLQPVSGKDLMVAYVVGFEAGVRIGKASPGHHDSGWHLTGTLGTLAAGMASASLMRLNATQTNYCLGVSATQSAGLQQNRGTMSKSFHAGKAAHNGLLAAMLAQQGFDSSAEIIEGRKGFSNTFAKDHLGSAMSDRLGQYWEIMSNGHKPYACGVVLHPLIDGVIALRDQIPDFESVEKIELKVNPITIRITGIEKPVTGLQSKFSLYHSAAVACLDGTAGDAQYADERATNPQVMALRQKVSVEPVSTFGRDEAEVKITLKGGMELHSHIAHASGTRDNPMTDAAIQAKFMANAEPVIGQLKARQLTEEIWQLEKSLDVLQLLRLTAM
jgi:2-methylcitrate dehydratase PrpD